MGLERTNLFLEIRDRLKTDGKRADVLVLVASLLTNYGDDGLIRSPQAARRKTIVLDGITYWLVRHPSNDSDPPSK